MSEPNPLEMTTRRYFDFGEISGEILVSAGGAPAEHGIAVQTLDQLHLNCERLQRQRAVVLEDLNGAIIEEAEALESGGLPSDVAIDQAMDTIAEALFSDPNNRPSFFTLQRWALGDAAEHALHALPYIG